MGGIKIKIKAPKIPSIKQIGRDINRAAINVGRSVESNAQGLGRAMGNGEIAKIVKGGAESAFNTVTMIPKATYAVAQGDTKKAGKILQKSAGSAINLKSFGLQSYFGQSSGVQNFMRDRTVDRLTLGLSGDYAGYSRGVSTLSSRGEISREDFQDALRLGGKTLAVASVFAFAGAQPPPLSGTGAGPGAGGPGGRMYLTAMDGAGGVSGSAGASAASTFSVPPVLSGVAKTAAEGALATAKWVGTGLVVGTGLSALNRATGGKYEDVLEDVAAQTPGATNFFDGVRETFSNFAGGGLSGDEASQGSSMLLWAGVAVLGFLVYQRVKK